MVALLLFLVVMVDFSSRIMSVLSDGVLVAGCRNSSNVRHKKPIIITNLPQIPEKSTLLPSYLF
ncbi:DUF3927 family protein [Escherichia coli]|uniref:DUF3927 family protein n=1 Tax=Escherichia coli TaxID=562 RepID=UPI003EDF437E